MKSEYFRTIKNVRDNRASEINDHLKVGLHPKNITLCMQWGWKGVFYNKHIF